MARDPFDGLDEGSPYKGSPQTPDSAGATRTAYPGFFPPGIPKKPIPREAAEHKGTFGRGSMPTDTTHLAGLTPIDFDPRVAAPIGVNPTRFDHDPRSDIGSTTDRSPAFVVMTRLKTLGAEPWMFSWVQYRGQQGTFTEQTMLDQTRLLAHYGDTVAASLWTYMMQVNQAILRAQNAQRQAQARGLGIVRR